MVSVGAYSLAWLPPGSHAPCNRSPRRSSPAALLRSGSYSSPVTQRRCSNTESLRATATTARFWRSCRREPRSFRRVGGGRNPLRRAPAGSGRFQPEAFFGHPVAPLGDAPLGVALSRLVLLWNEPEVGAHRPAVFETLWILDAQHECQGSQRAHARHLSQQPRLWVEFLRYRLESLRSYSRMRAVREVIVSREWASRRTQAPLAAFRRLLSCRNSRLSTSAT